MNVISITYTYKYELDFSPKYKWTTINECFNSKTNRKLKQVYNCGSIGYIIDGKFKSLSYLRKHIVKCKKESTPF